MMKHSPEWLKCMLHTDIMYNATMNIKTQVFLLDSDFNSLKLYTKKRNFRIL